MTRARVLALPVSVNVSEEGNDVTPPLGRANRHGVLSMRQRGSDVVEEERRPCESRVDRYYASKTVRTEKRFGLTEESS
jgi:hypothetical protein